MRNHQLDYNQSTSVMVFLKCPVSQLCDNSIRRAGHALASHRAREGLQVVFHLFDSCEHAYTQPESRQATLRSREPSRLALRPVPSEGNRKQPLRVTIPELLFTDAQKFRNYLATLDVSQECLLCNFISTRQEWSPPQYSHMDNAFTAVKALSLALDTLLDLPYTTLTRYWTPLTSHLYLCYLESVDMYCQS